MNEWWLIIKGQIWMIKYQGLMIITKHHHQTSSPNIITKHHHQTSSSNTIIKHQYQTPTSKTNTKHHGQTLSPKTNIITPKAKEQKPTGISYRYKLQIQVSITITSYKIQVIKYKQLAIDYKIQVTNNKEQNAD